MAFEVIQGFNMSKNAPLDETRIVAADENAMLAIKWVYKGLLVARIDTSPIEFWTCDVAAATLGPAAPYTVIGDWSEFTGTNGADGTDGSKIFTGTGVPSDALGVNTDFYLDNATGDYYTKAAGTWGSAQGNLTGPTGTTGNTGAAGADGDTFTAASVSSVNIPTSHPTDVVLTLDSSDYDYIIGQPVIASEDVDNYFLGTVKTWVAGVLTITSSSNVGTGSAPTTAWDISLSGLLGPAGAAGATGSTGSDGSTGATGATGPAGADGAGAPLYGQIYTHAGAGTQVVASGVPEILTQFVTNGISSSGITPDQTNDKVILTAAGVYEITIDLSFTGTNSSSWIISAYANVDGGGATEIPGGHIERKLGTGGDVGATSFSTFFEVNEGETVDIESWIEGDGANTFVLEYGTISILNLGAQGPTGATGAGGGTGSTGADGATGPTGNTGAGGATGAAGSNGAAGSDGSDGAVGKAFIHTEDDVTLTAGKITTVEGGAWTAIDPWMASIANDARSSSEKNATAGIIGTMTNNSIAYDGTAWWNNGRWLGLTGAQGDDGDAGPIGPTGLQGPAGPGSVRYHLLGALSSVVTYDLEAQGLDLTIPNIIDLNLTINAEATATIRLPSYIALTTGINFYGTVKAGGTLKIQIPGAFTQGQLFASFIQVSGYTGSDPVIDLTPFLTPEPSSGDKDYAFQITKRKIVGTSNYWSIVGGVAEIATYSASNFVVWTQIVDDPGFFTNSSNIYSGYYHPPSDGRTLIDIGATHYNTAGLINKHYVVNFQTWDDTESTLISTTTHNIQLSEATQAANYRAHTSIVATLATDKAYRVWLRVLRQIGVEENASRFIGTDTFGVTYTK